MIIGVDFKPELCNGAELKEMNINHDASTYLVNNIEALVKFAASQPNVNKDKAEDMVNDVFVSLLVAENNGEGFDPSYGDGMLDVSTFVKGRIKGYACNAEYSKNTVEVGKKTMNVKHTVETVKTDMSGKPIKDRKGNKKIEKQVINEKVTSTITVYAASGADLNGEATCDNFQLAYANAAVADASDNIDAAISIREQIENCIDICELHGFNLLNLFKNLDKIQAQVCALGSSNKKKSSDSVFYDLTKLIYEHDELESDLHDIFKFIFESADNRALFNSIVAAM